MQKTLVLTLTAFSLSACANATRTIPVPTVEQRSINLISDDEDIAEYKERPRLVVPVDRQTLPPPIEPKPVKTVPSTLPKNYKDPVIESFKKNNYIR